ncbi:2-C-methyl-D-erythritol 4-phosphate cytidylyltransferase [Anaerobium acetethylicum]|uniref:2-C-methyl-D-erythritol 4-phosphate cytidylyltransferase n=1 Tax=Anaerobium acetethylicum TaxID=1619234 RepID=A0A1D3TXE9_9FIRM|nr:2-C-methyl-D-erythritol 4-phosphate cytidylyltransferase [Anaerobium acetethylicum]
MQFLILNWENGRTSRNSRFTESIEGGLFLIKEKAEKVVAIVLAAGQGTRMNSPIQKQFLLVKGKPLVYYSLLEFQESDVDEIILVVSPGCIESCRQDIVETYNFDKVVKIIEGGQERYNSVYNGIKAIGSCAYLLIHDGARPFVDQEIIKRTIESVKEYRACVVGMPVKDTIKIADGKEFIKETPDRSLLWQIQTPQAFEYSLVKDAYEKVLDLADINVTDDAMVVEAATDIKVKLIRGSYENIKITTPEDLKIAEVFCCR